MFERLQTWRGLRWSAGLLSFALLISGLGFAVASGDEPKQDDKKQEPKKDQPKKKTDKDKIQKQGAPDFGGAFRNLPQGADPEQLREMQAEMQRMMQQMRQRFGANGFQGGGFQGGVGGPFGGFAMNHDGRLGVRVSSPSAALTDQLQLPKGQGLVVEDVQADSAAAKAGIKNNDILLELAGKAVPANPRDFVKQLDGVKADAKVDAVVLRKGKRETIKDLSLPEAKAANGLPFPPLPPKGGIGGAGGAFPGGIPGRVGGLPGGFGAPGVGLGGGAGFGGAGGHNVMTTVFRTDDRFTTRHQEGTLVITVTGTIADGKAKVSGIQVQDGRESHKYESLDKVPDQYRDKAKNLIEMSEKSGVKVEIKTPKIDKQ